MNLQDEIEKAWKKHKPLGVSDTAPPSMEFVDGFMAGLKIGETAEREACATWYANDGWLLDEDDVADAMRKRSNAELRPTPKAVAP